VTRPNEFAHWDPRLIDGPVVAAASALNGLGFDPWQTWAFRRAELTAYAASAFRCPNGKALTMGAIRTFPPQARAELRMESIVTALLDAIAPDVEALGPVRGLAALVTLSALPSPGDPGYQSRASRIVRRVNDWLVERLPPGASVVVEHDHRAHAGLAHALLRAVPALLEDRIDAALAALRSEHDRLLVQRTPASLMTRMVAAATFVALPDGIFHRRAAGKSLLAETNRSPLLASAPAGFRAELSAVEAGLQEAGK